MVCEVGAAMDMSGEGAGSGASALQQRWYEGRVNGSPAAGDVNEANGDGFFHSPLEGGHHSRARYYHQQMHAPYSAAVGSHGELLFLFKNMFNANFIFESLETNLLVIMISATRSKNQET